MFSETHYFIIFLPQTILAVTFIHRHYKNKQYHHKREFFFLNWNLNLKILIHVVKSDQELLVTRTMKYFLLLSWSYGMFLHGSIDYYEMEHWPQYQISIKYKWWIWYYTFSVVYLYGVWNQSEYRTQKSSSARIIQWIRQRSIQLVYRELIPPPNKKKILSCSCFQGQ